MKLHKDKKKKKEPKKMKELDTAIKACKKAGTILLNHFNKDIHINEKADASIVTEADLAAEHAILAELKANYPTYSFYSEESGLSADNATDSEFMWVIDPLDGTNNFAVGIPQFAVSIALLKNGSPIIGVIYHPFLDTIIYAEKNKGAFINNKPLIPTSTTNPKQVISLIAGYPSANLQKEMSHKISNNVKRILTQWTPATDFMLLCQGKIDSMISLDAESEDQVAGLLIAKEAGCEIRTIDGKPYEITEFSTYLPKIIISKNKDAYHGISKVIPNQ